MSKDKQDKIEKEEVTMEEAQEAVEQEATEKVTEEKQENAIDENEKKYLEIKDKYTRLLADFDNQKRRSAQETIEAQKRGKIQVFEQLLEVLDNFDRAMNYEVSTQEYKDGMELVRKQLKERLEGLGLKRVPTEGLLDPAIHQAIMVETVEDKENDEILEELQPGYALEDSLIRAAMVKVNSK